MPRVLMVAALVSGAAVRLAAVATSSLWIDEFVTLWPISGTLSETLARGRYTCSTPLFLIVERASLSFWGRNALGLRFPAVVAGTLAIYFAWWAVQRIWRDRWAASVAAWMLALQPSMLWYSLDGRPYSLCAALGLIIVAALVDWLQRGSPRMLALATGATALAVHFQLIALLWIPAENLLVAGWGLHRRWSRWQWARWLSAQLALGIVVLPVVSCLRTVGHRTQSLIIEPAASWDKWIESSALLNEWYLLGGLAILMLVLIAIQNAGRWMPALAGVVRDDIAGLACAVVLGGVPTLLIAVLAEHGRLSAPPRYFLLFAPGFWLVGVWALARMTVSPWLARASFIGLVAGLAAYSLNPFGGWQTLHRHSDWRRALAFVDHHSAPGELIALRSGLVEASDVQFLQDPLARSYVDCPLIPFYVQRSWNHVALPFTLYRRQAREYLDTTVRDRLSREPSFWLVNAGPLDWDYRPWIRESLGPSFACDQQREFLGVFLAHYVRTGHPVDQPN